MQNSQNFSDKFGFIDKKEFIPQIFANLEKQKVCKDFLTLYNANVDKEYKIQPKFAKNCTNLKQIFTNFINQNLAKKPLNFAKISKFCVISNVVIHSFLQGKSQPKFANLPNLKVAKIIFLLRNSFDFGIVFDGDKIFKNFVFDKISNKNKNCKIFLNKELIIVEKNGFKLGIMPNFKQICDLKSNNFDCEIKQALLLGLGKKLNMLYLVYPKNKYFTKHIEVKSTEFEPNFKVKLVPYSINNKIF